MGAAHGRVDDGEVEQPPARRVRVAVDQLSDFLQVFIQGGPQRVIQ